jgi:tetratricopeptide (TPR) repeat protein
MKMFRIVLELNDLSLLRISKSRLIGELLGTLRSLGSDTADLQVRGSFMQIETEGDSALALGERLFALNSLLTKQRLKLHGYLLGLDYTPTGQQGFTFGPDGCWAVMAERPDMFLVSAAAFPVMAPYFELEECRGGYEVRSFIEARAGDFPAFESLAMSENLELVRDAIGSWRRSSSRERPLLVHTLIPEEQYRLALACAVAGGCETTFPLIDLNYPWRSPAGAFLGSFGPGAIDRFRTLVSEQQREAWEKRGKTLLEGYNLFCVEDIIFWMGETLEAYSREQSEQGRVPVVVVAASERLNRVGRLISERLLEPMHRRGELYCLFLAGEPPISRPQLFSFSEITKAPGSGFAGCIQQRDGHFEYSQAERDKRDPPVRLKAGPKAMLEVAALFSPFMPSGELQRRLYEGGYEKHLVDQMCTDLIASGGAFKTWRYFFTLPRPGYRTGRGEVSHDGVRAFITAVRETSAAPFLPEYAALAAELIPEEGEPLYLSLLRALYERSYGLTGSVGQNIFAILGRNQRSLQQACSALQHSFMNERSSDRVKKSTAVGYPGIEALMLTLKTEGLLRAGDVGSALDTAKDFLYKVQEHNEPCLTAEAQNAIGSAMLQQGKIEEANDYFALSYEASKSCGSPMDRIRSRMNQALSLFLFGNYSRADRLLTEGTEAASGLCHGPYLLFAQFLKARIAFKLGRYAESEEQLWHALSLATILKAPYAVFYAWIGRARVYSGRSDSGRDLLESLPASPEILYYLSEDRYFEGDNEAALHLIRKASKLQKADSGGRGGYGSFRWDTGYRDIEDCAFLDASGRGVLQNCITVFRTYLESRRHPDPSGREVLERVTRSEKLGELDPFLHYYFLFHALLISEETHNEALERITYLSKGLKYLQRIGSVIDDVPARLDFLQKNRWNRYLMELAREEKLA